MPSKIDWCQETVDASVGCSPVSEGCKNCYARKLTWRMAQNPNPVMQKRYRGSPPLVLKSLHDDTLKWTGEVHCCPDQITKPLHWRKPRRIFWSSRSDLFHEKVPFEFIDRCFAVMALTPQHQHLVLTKRAERMLDYGRQDHDDFEWRPRWFFKTQGQIALAHRNSMKVISDQWPLPNVLLGVSVENQARWDERIPHLAELAGLGWRTFVSIEPMLSSIDLQLATCDLRPSVIIVGGESGKGARPMHPVWARSIIEQCQAAGVGFFMKQMGGHPNKRHNLDDIPPELRIRYWPGGTGRKA